MSSPSESGMIPDSEGDDIGDVTSHHRGEDVAPAD
jgi:hypothetical protein